MLSLAVYFYIIRSLCILGFTVDQGFTTLADLLPHLPFLTYSRAARYNIGCLLKSWKFTNNVKTLRLYTIFNENKLKSKKY